MANADADAAPANNNPFILPDGAFGLPEYEPVSFENLEQDTIYLVRMTTHDLAFVDLVLQTTHAENWRTDNAVRPKLMGRRGFKRVVSIQKMLDEDILIPDEEEAVEDADGDLPLHVADVLQHDGEIMNIEEFADLVGDHGKAEDVFREFEYAIDGNGTMISDDYTIFDDLLTYPVGKDFIRMEISAEEFGYVFFKKVEQQVGGKSRFRKGRRTRRRRRSSKQRTGTRRRGHSQR